MYFGPSISVGRRGVSYGDSDAQAFIAATGLTGTTEVNAVNNLVANLKQYGLWSKMKAIYPFVSDTVNQLSYTSDLSNAYWTKTAVTLTQNAGTAPDGTNTANKIIETTATSGHWVKAIFNITASTTYTMSGYFKAAGRNYVALIDDDSGLHTAYFNLSTGTLVSQSGFTSTSITSVGNGWYRCTATRNSISTLSNFYWAISSDGTTYNYTGDGVNGVYIWGQQWEYNASATTYQPIATTPANRFVSQFKYNLKDARDLDAAFRLAFNGTWTYSKQGATPNGVNGFANTYVNAQSNLTFNNTHLSYYSRTDTVTGSKTEMGCVPTATLPLVALSIKRTEGGVSDRFVPLLYSYNSPDIINVSNTNSQGYYLASRTASNSFKGFKNGVQLGSTVTTNGQASAPNLQIYLGATNFNNSGSGFSDRQTAFSTIGDGLTDTEATNLYTSVQLFQQELARYVGVPIVSDANAQAFLDAAVITDQTQANAVNTLVTDLKTYGLWTKMKAIYPFVGGTATTHKWNLKDPRDLDAAYRLAFSGAWTHSSTGALPNGTNAYADSFITPSANLNANSTHVSYYSRTNVTTNAGTEIGTWYSGYNYGIELNLYRSVAAQKTAAIINSGGGAAQINGGSITPTTGLLVGSRIANNNGFVSKNGATIGTNTTTVTTQLSTFKIYLGAANNFGTAGAYSNKESAFASIGDGITEAEATTLNTLVTNFETTLGRNV